MGNKVGNKMIENLVNDLLMYKEELEWLEFKWNAVDSTSCYRRRFIYETRNTKIDDGCRNGLVEDLFNYDLSRACVLLAESSFGNW